MGVYVEKILGLRAFRQIVHLKNERNSVITPNTFRHANGIRPKTKVALEPT